MITRASAGILVPASNRITSPGTRFFVATSTVLPSRSTRVRGAESFLRASIDFRARLSWMNPVSALTINTVKMTMPLVFFFTAKEISAANNRM
ncbi:MAG: hypothetical protein BWY83_02596 [bacterium ADurb.Bin478]|nr:MAG: hypothetical protein BWY83_02596 [bacterium ADurb.Bin478]